MYPYHNRIKQRIKADVIEMEVMPDHVHLLIEVDPQYGINKDVRHIRGGNFSHFAVRVPGIEISPSYLVD